MTLTQIQYFYTVCKYENYTKAAEELLVSQPAVSQAMRNLEEECGAPLFIRQGNSLTVTEQGRVLLDEARIVLRQMENLNHVAHDLSLERRYVRIGLSTFSGNTVFPRLRRKFHLAYPDIEVLSHENITSALFNMLDTGRVDLIITSPSKQFESAGAQKNYAFYSIKTDGLVFCVHRNHPLAGKDMVTVEEMAAEPLVLLEDHYSPTKNVKALFRAHGLEPNVIHYTSQMYTVERFVEQGAAAGFLPAETVRHNMDICGIKYPRPDKTANVALIWRKKSVQYDSVKKFIAMAKKLYPKRQEQA